MTDWIHLRELPVRRIVGLMSGTSVDGIDAALVQVSGTGETLRLERILATHTRPYTNAESERIHALFDGNVAEICEMNVVIAEWFAEATRSVIERAGLRPEDVHLIGSHGQTIFHIPPGSDRRPSTLQIGEAQVIAERTGIPVVSNFRPRDIAAGGEGAPLVPYVDWALCRRPDETIALQNIGGIANVTVVTPSIDDVLAFDTGPGNMIIDAAAAIVSRGKQSYDIDGRLAAAYSPDEERVRAALQDPYFRRTPPKSTGREYWGVQYVQQAAKTYSESELPRIVADMTEITVQSIRDAYNRFVFPKHTLRGVFVSGGGARNPVLMRRMVELFAPIHVGTSDELGLPADAKEAIAFAILANETLCGTPANVPSATGARERRVLGSLTPGVR